MFYSPSKNQWFAPEFRPQYEAAGSWPDDATEYQREVFDEVVTHRPADKAMEPNSEGYPVLVELPVSITDQIWEHIKSKRDRIKAGGALVAGKWFHTDTDSRIQHLGLKDSARDILAAGGAMTDVVPVDGELVPWKTMDGTFVQPTVQLVFDIVAAVKKLDKLAFRRAEIHRAAMSAAASPLEYDFSAGWPTVYSDTLAQQA